ncbi:MAG: transporter substrate-binding domain-containing protein [Alphaproteobacteria bacterium]|nr:transporter substrate-binding domain-containing protein [Alphaproteobacteria bacterium]
MTLRGIYISLLVGTAWALAGWLPAVLADDEAGQAPIAIIGAHLEGRLDNDPASGYNRLVKYLLPIDQSVAVFQRYPLVRALRQFEDTKRSCLFPASARAAQNLIGIPAEDLVESSFVDFVSSHVMVKPGGPFIADKTDIYGRTIAIQRGVEMVVLKDDYDRFDIIRTPDDQTALKMLQAGRIDGMYGWNPDALIIATKYGIELPDFNPDFILFQTTTHFVCKKGIGAERLLNLINGRIAIARRTGQLKEMLGPFARLEKE